MQVYFGVKNQAINSIAFLHSTFIRACCIKVSSMKDKGDSHMDNISALEEAMVLAEGLILRKKLDKEKEK